VLLSPDNLTDSVSNTSMGVDTFVSLILSYFCFLVPALSPCQGRLKKENVRKKFDGKKIMNNIKPPKVKK